ncbi:hypothetical protein BC938DRAFT_471985 [Jimgerdemannia flammicorona]|uniref:Uncharacterized protein n=1 Tax=Jimgerdemannia flammicorona TaxID=994334 RepID=A0A433QU99_9FUNG|nr:hypothetical protein BC938DRAFT_471985 [Jimgerdemannia flammicorona]
MAKLERVCDDVAGLGRRWQRLDKVRVLRDHGDQLLSRWLGQQRDVRVGVDGYGGVTLDGAETGVRILQIRSRVALEAEHAVPVEVVIADTAGSHVLDLDGGNSNDVGDGVRVLNLCVLFFVLLHHLVHCRLGLLQNLLKEHRRALAC